MNERFYLKDFGTTQRAAIRAVLNVWRGQGWRDSWGAAVDIVSGLVAYGDKGITARQLTSAVHANFYVENRTTRAQLLAAIRGAIR